MKENNIGAETKAMVKVVCKVNDKINQNSCYQSILKEHIKYINQELLHGNLEEIIECNRTISKIYRDKLMNMGFVLLHENEVREKGYNWNYCNLRYIRDCLQETLFIISTIDSCGEVFPDYLFEKLTDDGIKHVKCQK